MNKKLEMLLKEIDSIPLSKWSCHLDSSWSEDYGRMKTYDCHAYRDGLSVFFNSYLGDLIVSRNGSEDIRIHPSKKTAPIICKVTDYFDDIYKKQEEQEELQRKTRERQRKRRGYDGDIGEILKK